MAWLLIILLAPILAVAAPWAFGWVLTLYLCACELLWAAVAAVVASLRRGTGGFHRLFRRLVIGRRHPEHP